MKNLKRYTVVEAAGGIGRIDKDKGVIYDALILTKKSKNRREYTDEALDDAVRIYEGLDIYIDHKLGGKRRKPTQNHSVDSHGGKLRNVRRSPEGLRADVHYNRATKAGSIVLEAAERFPDSFGFSHHAIVEGYETSDGVKVIQAIVEAKSVDLVKDPATTNGIWESVMNPILEQLEAAVEAVRAELGQDGEEVAEGAEPVAKKSFVEQVAEALVPKLVDALLPKLQEAVKPARTGPQSKPRSTVTETVDQGRRKAAEPKTPDAVLAAWGDE